MEEENTSREGNDNISLKSDIDLDYVTYNFFFFCDILFDVSL